jgi:malate dehydrogenase (oxaloacetate-decarboxylating)
MAGADNNGAMPGPRDQRERRRPLPIRYRGARLLNHPLHNKSTAFTREERELFGLEGLLPDVVSTMERQVRRVYGHISRKTDDLEKYIGLAALQDRNEHLFYAVLTRHLAELLPIVYTPTVGRACQEYSRIFRRPRGLWITPRHRGRIERVLGNAPSRQVRLIVATDGERILGVGDQGAGGMGVPIGKLSLYTAAAGIHPGQTLAVCLDVGTDNAALLEDELYIGWPHGRLRGSEYDELVDEFVQAVKSRFPRALLQWEDFKQQNAFRILERYRGQLPSFNDDVQGTGAMVVAAVMAASRLTGVPMARQRALVLGAGAAGVGIALMLRAAAARAGLSGDELTRAVAVLDLPGLLVDEGAATPEFRRAVAWPAELAAAVSLGPGRPADLETAVRALRPTVLVGVTGAPGTFTEAAVREMAAHTPRPVILPLSNPTSYSEARPADLLEWTGGRALVATGSPFAPVAAGDRVLRVAQANNAFIFPGLGLGTLVAEAREVTDGMLLAAAGRLAEETALRAGRDEALFPPMAELRDVTAVVAEAVVREVRRTGLGRELPDEGIPEAVRAAMWAPVYPRMQVEPD